MTAILGIVDAGRLDGAELARRILTSMALRGCDRGGMWTDDGVTLAASRHQWECRAGFAGPVLVVQDAHVLVAADATLYYRDDLRRRLSERRIRVSGQTPSHLIAAAYRAWGDRCAEYLEGDFAFVLWDQRAKQMIAARDLAGSRPLYYTQHGSTGVAFASSARALLRHPSCDSSLNLDVLADRMAGLANADGTTCYAGVARLEAGETASFVLGRGVHITRNSHALAAHGESQVRDGDASEELCRLLCRATDERKVASQRTAIWLLDDFGSTSVFAAAMSQRQRDRTADVLPIAVRGELNENECNSQWLEHLSTTWRLPMRWAVPNAEGVEQSAHDLIEYDGVATALRGGAWNAVSSTAARLGARVLLDGTGSVRLFSPSRARDVELPDTNSEPVLDRRPHEAVPRRANFTGALKHLFRRLPNTIERASSSLFDTRALHDTKRSLFPEWIEPAFARRAGIGNGAGSLSQRNGESRGVNHVSVRLDEPLASNAMAARAARALAQGVELRSPYCDKRVVAFATSRLQAGSVTADDDMRSRVITMLFSESAVDAQSWHQVETGNAGYTRRLLLERLTVNGDPSFLTQLGLIDLRAFRAACDRYRQTLDPDIAIGLSRVLETEQWLQCEEQAIAANAGTEHIASATKLASAG